ncbi:MAG: hypothetical protein ACKO4U_08585 [Caldilinea sp.]
MSARLGDPAPKNRTYCVLVVENDPQQCADHVANLEGWGYRVCVAEMDLGVEDRTAALCQNALGLAAAQQCDLAMVDLRLQSDVNPADETGVALAQALLVAGGVILSAYATPACDRLGERWVCVGKQDGPEELRATLAGLVARLLQSD